MNMFNASNIYIDAPRLTALLVSIRLVYAVFSTRGAWLGLISALITLVCITPLFKVSTTTTTQVRQPNTRLIPSITTEENQLTSQIFAEATAEELDTMRAGDHSIFGRLLHNTIEVFGEDVEELIYVARVLRENQSLLILLLGGISSMMLAIVAGLDSVNVFKALCLSVTCYGITTILVARSARRIVHQHIAQICEPKLSSDDISKILQTVSEESFITNDELDNCDLSTLETMLSNRGVSQKEDIGGDALKKTNMIEKLSQIRNYNETCCICLSQFTSGERIRVLPNCKHEFHSVCIVKWASTFAANERFCRKGKPTCPLDNTHIGEVKCCSPVKTP